MADDKPVSGVAITGLTPALGQQIFVLRVQHREPLDLLEMTVDAGFGRKDRPGDGAGHGQRFSISFETKLSTRSAFLPALTRSPGPRLRSRTFKRRPVALHRKPSRRLRRVGIWSGSHLRLMDEASRS